MLEAWNALWNAINSPIGLTVIGAVAAWLIARLVTWKPAWLPWQGTIIAAIRYAEKAIPDNVSNTAARRLDEALRYVLRVYTSRTNKLPPPSLQAALEEGIQILHNEIENQVTPLKPVEPVGKVLTGLLAMMMVMFSATGCIGSAVEGAVAQAKIGIIDQDRNVQQVLDRIEKKISVQDAALTDLWFEGMLKAAAANKLNDPAVAESARKRLADLRTEVNAQYEEVRIARQTAAKNTEVSLKACDYAVKAGYSLGTREEVAARLDRMEALLQQAITKLATSGKSPRRRRRRGEPAVAAPGGDAVPPSATPTAVAAAKDAIATLAVKLQAADASEGDPGAAFFEGFDTALAGFKDRKALLLEKIDDQSPEFLAAVAAVDQCVDVWEAAGMALEKILPIAMKLAGL